MARRTQWEKYNYRHDVPRDFEPWHRGAAGLWFKSGGVEAGDPVRALVNDWLPVYIKKHNRAGKVCTFRATTADLLGKEFYIYNVKEDMLVILVDGELYRLAPTRMPHMYAYELSA